MAESIEEDCVGVKYFKAKASNDVKKIKCLAVFLVEHFSKCCHLVRTLESFKIPLIHLLESKLSDLCKSFTLQVLLKSFFQAVGRARLKLPNLLIGDPGKSYFFYWQIV